MSTKSSRKACYAVTGGAGFIGSHIARQLVADGKEVRIVDNFSTGRPENLEDVSDKIEVFEGDVCDAALLRRAFDGAEVVFHEAAMVSVQRSVDDPMASNRVNVEGTLQVLEAARACGLRRVVYAGSSSAYGDTVELPKREDMTPSPKSPYAVSKLAGEQYCRVYAGLFGVETVVLRYFNVFGPRQNPRSRYAAVIPQFATALLAGKAPTVFGDGEQSRDFTYVANVVEANLGAARSPGVSGRVFNVACGHRYSLNELLDALRRIIGTDVEATYEDPKPGDVKHSLADITPARTLLGYEPVVGFEEGLRRTVEWYRGAR